MPVCADVWTFTHRSNLLESEFEYMKVENVLYKLSYSLPLPFLLICRHMIDCLSFKYVCHSHCVNFATRFHFFWAVYLLRYAIHLGSLVCTEEARVAVLLCCPKVM